MINKQMKAWMSAATTAEQEELAAAANTSRGMLYQLSSGERTAGPALARRIELASKGLRRENPKLPLIRRTELCPACGECEFAKKCGG